MYRDSSLAPARKRERRMEAAWSLLRSAPSQSNQSRGSASETATWTAPSAARVRSRPSNLQSTLRASPSFPLSRRDASTPLRTPEARVARPVVQSWTDQATQTEDSATYTDTNSTRGPHLQTGIHLGDFGEVETMTAATVDFLIRVLEDRKQELLVSRGDSELRVTAIYTASENVEEPLEKVEKQCTSGRLLHLKLMIVVWQGLNSPTSKIARIQLDSESSGVTELVRSASYERLLQLEGDLEARHNKIMSDGLLETIDDNS
ncbi:uncharacterized protein PITG_16079 [Phytophthora infestans T30-4]|uniref:Uncharacterized protein n=1 Tax=Phytophthora infestans (strain T30-4) TaxID=403677 RepID=D0NSU2_PHYIT|nr:uncharacterized protein PITG_16079 [Phytophthora infestans T30-4]EEY64654.1 conserved hypothetical protein [Phytophthora infestans T30-4]|eukprot:XP_002897854.1 conserved hypothetical protein [Phytophthora infestans T30-4]